MKRLLFFTFVLLFGLKAFAQYQITANEVFSDIAYLASDDKKGRFPCTPQSHQVSFYLRDVYIKHGLKLMADSGFQYFDIAIGAQLTGTNFFKLNGQTYQPSDTTYYPYAFSDTGTFSADTIVFIGYGFDLKQGDSLIWNDYQNINVKGKWVVAFKGYPKDTLTENFFRKQRTERFKASVAKDHGALGIIFINQPNDKKLTPFVMPRFSVKFDLAILEISNDLTKQLLGKDNSQLASLLKKDPHYHFTITAPVQAQIHYKIKHCKARNVIAVLKSNDPKYSDHYIVIGAHYDHLGMGGYESGSRMPDTIAVHNGADDNASGTAGVIELAKYLADRRDSLKRSIIFINFDAEERGLLGSAYFVNHPTVPKDKIDFMINMDMIGRYNGKVSVMGVGTAKEAKKIFQSIKYDTNQIKVKLYDKAYGGSDHASFIDKGIPAVFFYSSDAKDYHTPFDDIDKIKPKKEAQILNYIAKLAIKLSDYPGNFTFVSQKEQGQGNKYGGSVRLGIRPSFTFSGKGLQIDGVDQGGPADKAGLRPGDIIIAIGDKKVENIYDYMNALSAYKPGDKATITIVRNKKQKKVKVKF